MEGVWEQLTFIPRMLAEIHRQAWEGCGNTLHTRTLAHGPRIPHQRSASTLHW